MFGTTGIIAVLLIGYKVLLYWIRLQQEDLKRHRKGFRESFADRSRESFADPPTEEEQP